MHELHRLEFDNPTFRDGVNVTVRNGEKWKDRVQIGDIVELDTGAAASRCAKIVGILYDNFHNIPAPVHALNHDPACRTVTGIAKELARIYGPFPNDIIGDVTVVFFRPDNL